jgi:glycosyltransferase involved in cell wall biosynthesis
VRKIRVAFLVDTISSAGAGTEKQLLEIIARLDRERFDPFVISLRRSAWMKQHALPCPAFDLGYRGFLKPNLPAVIGRYRALLREHAIDLVQTFFEESIFIGFAGDLFNRNRPLLLSSRRDVGLVREHPWYHFLFRMLKPFVNRRYHAVIANGSNVKRHVIEKERIPGAKVFVVPNGVALDHSRRERPASLGATAGRIWIVIVANLKPVKRHDLLIDALGLLRQQHPELDLGAVLLGAGSEQSRLTEQVARSGLSGRILFEGSVRDVQAYLQHVDLGVLCSEREGLSNAVLEYMSAGLPVVATAVGENADLVDQTNGALVPAADPQALAEALGRISADAGLRQRMGQASLAKVKAGFSWEHSMEQLQQLYVELMGRRK